MIVQNTNEYFLKKQAAVQEMLAGTKAATKLQGALRAAIATETVKHTGELMRSTAQAIADENSGQLDRITITSPDYGFKLNYGFEGKKRNKIYMLLNPTNHLHSAIERTNILNQLATELGNIRAEQVTATINF